ncbi:transmembrane epididymal protein 1 [Callorhinchus milii]|uniref:transmembrane epididymal protein 1 n=1 Tax=Callorhinchus milii TaxID=7868 RepID=UPI0004573117|nr:transmembrane epididymal protein 1 [Callorhinchus milii]|eukprot:gi/632968607/ref/XP_007900619.1/ PREDICTED: transmembrane epididymal protein 1 [Callorhinchus milii]
MGTFIGHISPGLAFFSFGLLYGIRYSLMVLRGEMGPQVAPTRSPGLCGWWRRVPAEGVMKVLYGTAAAMAELFYPPGVNKAVLYNTQNPDYPFIHPNEWQHLTMYSYFALSGWMDILSQTCLPKRLVLLERVAIAVAFYVEALILAFHMHGKGHVENSVHLLLFLITSLVCLVLTVELWRPHDPILWFSKTCLVMIQGTWLFHAAFILYRPPTGKPWKSEDMANQMFVTNFFCWHIALNLLFLALLFSLAYLWHRLGLAAQRRSGVLHKTKVHLHLNGEALHSRPEAREEEIQLLQVDEF